MRLVIEVTFLRRRFGEGSWVGSGERQGVPHVPMACLWDELTNDNGHDTGSHPPGKFGRCDPDLWIHCEISYPAAYPGSFALEDEEGG